MTINLFFLTIIFTALFLYFLPARAATLTVCASGCDHTTIGDAITAASASDTISLTEDYHFGGAEAVDISKALTLDCDGNKIWGDNTATNHWITISAVGSTINNCTIEYDADDDGTAVFPTDCAIPSVDNYAIHDNAGYSTFTNNTITNFRNSIKTIGSDITASANTLNACENGMFLGMSGTVTGNTINVAGTNGSSGVYISAGGATGTLTFSNNTITSYEPTDAGVEGVRVSLGDSDLDLIISGNTISGADGKYLERGLQFENGSLSGSGSLTISENTIYNWTRQGYAVGFTQANQSLEPSVTITGNTFYSTVWEEEENEFNSSAINLDSPTKINSLTIQDNIIYGGDYGVNFSGQNSTNLPSVTLDYNMYYGQDSGSIEGGFQTIGSNSIELDPYFTDASGGDFSLKAFSRAIGAASDSNDLGVEDYVGSRDTTLNVPADISDPGLAISYAADNDTVDIAAGTHSMANLGTLTASNVTISGAGATSILNVTTGGSAITSSGDSNTISDIKIQNVDNAYTVTNSVLVYDGNTYDAEGAGITEFITDTVSCEMDLSISSDGTDISDELNNENVHIILLNSGDGEYSTMLVSDSDISSSAEATIFATGPCEGVSALFLEDVFTYSSGTYTYHADVLSNAIVTVADSYSTPAITTSTSAAIKVTGDSNTIEDITTASVTGYGLWFSGSAADNTIDDDSTVVSTLDQLYSDSSGDNSALAYTDTYTSSGTGTITFTLGAAPSAAQPSRSYIKPPVTIPIPEVDDQGNIVQPEEDEVVDDSGDATDETVEETTDEVTDQENVDEVTDQENVDEITDEDNIDEEVEVIEESFVPILPEVRNIDEEVEAIKFYIGLEQKLPAEEDWKIVQFIAYGSSDITKSLKAKDRAALIEDYNEVYGANPVTEADWKIIDKMAKGEKPDIVSDKEQSAIEEFVKIYQRMIDLDSQADQSFVDILAYRLRISERSLEKEQFALKVFTSIYNILPNDSYTWSILRAIAYSGVLK